MRTYVVDGSTKGIVVGAGVVEVLPSGFIETHCFQTYHIKPSAIICEVYAFNSALDLIIDRIKRIGADKNEKVTVYTDNDAVFKYFWREISKDEKDEYLNGVKRKVIFLKKCINFSVKKKSESIEELAELAHHLSRTYMDDEFCSLLFDEENIDLDRDLLI